MAEVDVSRIISQSKSSKYTIVVDKTDDLEYDLGNLACYDTHPLDDKLAKKDINAAILSAARDNLQLLVNKIWELPTTIDAEGVYVSVPAGVTALPRALPMPKDNPETRWEKFAKMAGIRKKKKDKIVFDEASGEWKRRFGYGSIKDDSQQWLFEEKEGEKFEGNEDPWTKRATEKKERIEKNKKNAERNTREAIKADGKPLPSTLAHTAALVSHDTRDGTTTDKKKLSGVAKRDIAAAYDIAKSSTASLGRFDKFVEGETTELRSRGKRHKFDPAIQETGKERASSLKLLDRVLGPDAPTVDTDKAAKMYNQSHEGKAAGRREREEEQAPKHKKKSKRDDGDKKKKKKKSIVK